MSDYSSLVATGLARQGNEVHVWAPALNGSPSDDLVGEVAVHRAPGRWTSRGLAALDAALDAFPAPRRLLVQYAPNVWGAKGLNLGFARWLGRRQRGGDAITTMFHEVWYHPEPRDKVIRRILPPVQRWMARRVARASERVFVSILRWKELLSPALAAKGPPLVWLPVPSNVPVISDLPRVMAIREQVAPQGTCIVGSFGTFQDVVSGPLLEVIPTVLDTRGTSCVVLLMGRGSRPFAERLLALRPDLAGRIVATGGLAPEAASLHLQACDLLIQPYPEGVTTRRGTIMACLAHARPVVTSLGPLTEPVWSEASAVCLTPCGDAAALASRALELLADPGLRERIAHAAGALYDAQFSLEQTLAALAGTTRPDVTDLRPQLSPTP